MPSRSALLVGSLPFEDEATCMRIALNTLGPALFSLPDSEVDTRSAQFPRGNSIAWAIYAIAQACGQQVDIASSCGLGRRTPDEATRALELTAQLVAA